MCGRYYYVDKTAYEVEDDLHLFKGALATRRGGYYSGNDNGRDHLGDLAAAMDMLREPMPELDRSSDYEQLSLF